MVHAANNLTCPIVHALFSCLPQGYHVYSMFPDIIFQTLPSCSRLVTSHHVTYHVTAMSHAFSSSKRKEKEKENKILIKSENKRKRK